MMSFQPPNALMMLIPPSAGASRHLSLGTELMIAKFGIKNYTCINRLTSLKNYDHEMRSIPICRRASSTEFFWLFFSLFFWSNIVLIPGANVSRKKKTSNLTTRPHQSLKIYTDSSGPEFPEQPCYPEVSNSTSQCANAPTFAKLIKAG